MPAEFALIREEFLEEGQQENFEKNYNSDLEQ